MGRYSRRKFLANLYKQAGHDSSTAWAMACKAEMLEHKARENQIRKQVASDNFDMLNCTM